MKILVKEKDFSITAENNICFVTLSSPETQNAISIKTAEILAGLLNLKFDDFLKEQDCLLLVLRSAVAGVFSSGGHLSDLHKNSSGTCENYGASLRNFTKYLHTVHIPSLSILSGPSYGGGAELALATDFRWSIGSKSDLFFTQTKFGVPGGWGGMARLTELCPQLNHRKVSAMFLAQMNLSFEQMRYLGILDHVYANEEECFQALSALKDKIACCPPELRKDLMLRSKEKDVYEADVKIFDKFFLKEEHKSRIAAFFSKKNNLPHRASSDEKN